ncbi:endoribonuclease L-PSP [Komagataeibacter oboediens]|uniref:Endoribonuclease L-PSP n=2 Tax=Komagataeibacter oboediens TaxID=65958 RepID=A0A318QSR6_9PROT|nr:endoribonuclease L-PSP [Komagataeibacter oboediens]GBR30387.1 translation initiation inhibitor YjgF [Komagataeibacter oboediens DSM 11826]MBT0674412.1 endoribonuclease L-PSP [Komagataeibacter oboediens]MBT0678063.1 endoribonuclease L-PSP [Komagataeibacter oboediens]MBV0887791.1 endoribonuclease L-PSP [Komagataeibacter oboediens]
MENFLWTKHDHFVILTSMEEIMPFRPSPEIHIRHLTGFDATTGQFPAGLFPQIRQALATGMAQLDQQGMGADNVTRITFTLRETDGFSTCFPLLNDLFGRTCPATTLRLVKQFERTGQLAEIELVALPTQADDTLS